MMRTPAAAAAAPGAAELEGLEVVPAWCLGEDVCPAAAVRADPGRAARRIEGVVGEEATEGEVGR